MKILSGLVGGLIFALLATIAAEYISNASFSWLLVFPPAYALAVIAAALAATTRAAWTRIALLSAAAALAGAIAVGTRPWIYDGGRGPFFGMGTIELFMIPLLLVSGLVFLAIGLVLRSNKAAPKTTCSAAGDALSSAPTRS
jgi:hypothetical protein